MVLIPMNRNIIDCCYLHYTALAILYVIGFSPSVVKTNIFIVLSLIAVIFGMYSCVDAKL